MRVNVLERLPGLSGRLSCGIRGNARLTELLTRLEREAKLAASLHTTLTMDPDNSASSSRRFVLHPESQFQRNYRAVNREWRCDSAPGLPDSKSSVLPATARDSGNFNYSSRRSLKLEGGRIVGGQEAGCADRLRLWKALEICGDVLAKERCVFKPMSLIPAKVNSRTICSGKLHPANSAVLS